jgi:hypothetical protein
MKKLAIMTLALAAMSISGAQAISLQSFKDMAKQAGKSLSTVSKDGLKTAITNLTPEQKANALANLGSGILTKVSSAAGTFAFDQLKKISNSSVLNAAKEKVMNMGLDVANSAVSKLFGS